MNKYEFLYRLDKNLSSFEKAEREEITHYYDELIQDAVDTGENEIEFINRLGSIETIIRTIRRDSDFVNNVKEKKNFELKKVFSTTSKIIAHGIFLFILFIIGTIAFSFATSGISMFVVGVGKLLVGIKNSVSSTTMILYIGNMILGLGLTMLGLTGFWWLFKQSKDKLEKLLEWIQKAIDKKGEEK
jgi:uncharacterized membrane protein